MVYLQSPRYIVPLLCILTIMVWWPGRHLPSYWDSTAYAIPFAHHLFIHRGQLPPANMVSIHPPAYMYFLAILWYLFGQSLLVSHLFILGLSLGYILAAYSIARRLLTPTAALIATLLTLATPVFIAQSRTLYVDLPVAAFNLIGLAFLLHRRILGASIALTAALLTKTTALPFVVFSLVYVTSTPTKHRYRSIGILCIPIIAFICWSYIKFRHFGHWFVPPRLDQTIYQQLTPLSIATSSRAPIRDLFEHQLFPYLTILLGVDLLLLSRQKNKLQQSIVALLPFILITFLTSLFFGIVKLYHTKYILSLIPLWYISSIYLTQQALSTLGYLSRHTALLCTAILIVGLVYRNYTNIRLPHRSPHLTVYTSQEHTLRFVDMQQNWIDAANYLQSLPDHPLILGGFPEIFQLSNPAAGYVSYPLNVQACAAWHTPPPPGTIIYNHLYSPSTSVCTDRIAQSDAQLVKSFQTQGWQVNLYQVPSKPPPNHQ